MRRHIEMEDEAVPIHKRAKLLCFSGLRNEDFGWERSNLDYVQSHPSYR
jgi:hypothetical protein